MFENKPLHDREPLSGKMRGKQEKGPVMFAGKSRTRLIVLTGILALAAAALEFWPMPGAPSVHLKPIPIRFTDEAGLIDTHDRGAFNSELNLLYDEMGVDIRILVVPNPGGETLEEFAVQRARASRVGGETGGRSLFCEIGRAHV